MLRAFEMEATEQVHGLTAAKDKSQIKLGEAIAEFLDSEAQSTTNSGRLLEHDLLAELKLRAEKELVGEQERMIVNQAATLAAALAKLARQASQLKAARLLSLQRQEFVATLTHDLKNPLIGANRIFKLFMDGQFGELPKQQADLLQALKTSNSESLLLINTLNDIYRYESDPSEFNREPTDIVPIMKASFEEMQTWTTNRKIKLSLSLPDFVPSVKLDRSAIRRLLDNLLNNAVKFTATSVELRLICSDGKICIEVRDDGPGIPEAEQPLLFQRFSRCSMGKRYSGSGGLGLYLCKQIAAAHGGTISSASSPAGAVFTVTLDAP